LYNINESDFSLGSITEGLKDGCVFLYLGVNATYWLTVIVTYPYFTKSQTLDLVCSGAPVNRGHEALPEALNEF
jgi:hypothetical protein